MRYLQNDILLLESKHTCFNFYTLKEQIKHLYTKNKTIVDKKKIIVNDIICSKKKKGRKF